MTGRERIIKAMSGEIPDVVPVMPQITVPHAVKVLHGDSYIENLIRAIEDALYAVELMYEIALHYNVDGIRIPYNTSDIDFKVVNENGKYKVYNRSTEEKLGELDTITGNIVYENKNYIKTMDDIKKIEIPTVEEFLVSKSLSTIKKACEMDRNNFFRVGMPGGMTTNYLLAMRGNEQALIDLVENQDIVDALCDVGTEIAINRAKAIIKCGVDALYIGDAASSCSLISPSQFRQFCLPHYKKFVDEIKPMGVKIYLHVCGFVRPIVNMMVETGVHCIEPLDPLGGMSVEEFRNIVGDRAAIMGGVNTITLARGTPEQVRKEAEECIRAGAQKGRYILAAGDMVPNESSSENVKAMCDTAHSFVYRPDLMQVK